MEETLTENHLEPRRQPSQERSRQRVDDILDAVAEILVDKGFDAVTTRYIAERAKIPIGSVYQFFPNKFAIFYALAVRYLNEIETIHQRFVQPDILERPWEEVIDMAIDALARYWKGQKALPILFNGMQNAPQLAAADLEATKKSRQHNIVLLNRILPDLDEHRRSIIGRIMVHVSGRLLTISILDEAEDHPIVVEELKFLLKKYIQGHIDAQSAGPQGQG